LEQVWATFSFDTLKGMSDCDEVMLHTRTALGSSDQTGTAVNGCGAEDSIGTGVETEEG